MPKQSRSGQLRTGQSQQHASKQGKENKSPEIVLRSPEIVLNTVLITFDIAVIRHGSDVNIKSFEITRDDRERLDASVRKIEPFDINTNVADLPDQDEKWSYFNVSLKRDLFQGEHGISVQCADLSGKTSSKITQKVLIDLKSPEVKEWTPSPGSFTSALPRIEIRISDVQVPEVLQRSLKDLSEVGIKKRERLNNRGIFQIYGLLDIDYRTIYIEGLHPSEILDMVTKVQLINNLRFDVRSFEKLLYHSIPELVTSTKEFLLSNSNEDEQAIDDFLEQVRLIHTCFDRKALQKVLLKEFIKEPHSGLDTYQLYLDEKDVTSVAGFADNTISYQTEENLSEGEHTVRLILTDRAGNRNEVARHFRVDTTAPTVQLLTPQPNSILGESTVPFSAVITDSGSGIDTERTALFINGRKIGKRINKTPRSVDYLIRSLQEGTNTVRLECFDRAGNPVSLEYEFVSDRTPPVIVLDPSLDLQSTEAPEIEITGAVQEKHLSKLSVNGVSVKADSAGAFTVTLPLQIGANEIVAEAVDKAKNVSRSRSLTVFRTEPTSATFTGTVLTPQGNPIAGVRVAESGSSVSTVTNAQGKFILTGVPEGKLLIEIIPPSSRYEPAFIEAITKYGKITRQDKPICLLPVLTSEGMLTTEIDGSTIVENPKCPGMSISYGSSLDLEFPENSEQAIAVSLVSSERIPMELPEYVPAGQVARLEPSGLKVKNNAVIKLTLPNYLEADPDTQFVVVTYNKERGRWCLGGFAKTSKDGKSIETMPGLGLRHFSMATVAPLGANIEMLQEDINEPGADALKGGLETSITLPAFRSMNRQFRPSLVYSSLAAAPMVKITGVFKGLKEIASTPQTLVDRIIVDEEKKGKRVAPVYYYAAFLRYKPVYEYNFPGEKVYAYKRVNERLFDTRVESAPFFVPEGQDVPVIPMPESRWVDGIELKLEADHTSIRETLFYKIKIRNKVQRFSALWPESITARCWFSDQDTGEFTLKGPLTKIGPEPRPGEEDNREVYPRLPENMQITYHLEPKSSSGAYYPTGLYSFLSKYKISGRTYQATQSAVMAEEAFVNSEWLEWVKSNLDKISSEREQEAVKGAIQVIERASDLRRNGPEYQSQFAYSDMLDLMFQNNAGSVMVHNLVHSEFGRGWRFHEVQRLYPLGFTRALITGPEGKHVYTISDQINAVAHGLYGVFAKGEDGAIYVSTRAEKSDPNLINANTYWLEQVYDLRAVYVLFPISGSLILQILLSDEYRELHPGNSDDFIRAVFNDFIEREPTGEELVFWRGELERGNDYNFARRFLGSVYLGAYVRDWYRLILEREPNGDEVNNAIASYKRTLEPLVEEKFFVNELILSEEFEAMCPTNEAFVRAVYEKCMGRDPSEEELQQASGLIEVRGKRFFIEGYRGVDFLERCKDAYAVRLLTRLLGFEPPRSKQPSGARFVDHGIHRIKDGKIEMLDFYLKPVRVVRHGGVHRIERVPGATFGNSPQPLKPVPPLSGEKYFEEVIQSIEPEISGLAVDPEGSIYISDSHAHRIYKCVPGHGSGIALGFADTNDYIQPAVDIRYFDANGNRVARDLTDAEYMEYQRALAEGRDPGPVPMTMEYYQEWEQATGTGGRVQAGLSRDGIYISEDQWGQKHNERIWLDTPGGLAIDRDGNLIFAETGNNRVRKFNPETRELTTLLGADLDADNPEYDPAVTDGARVNLRAPIDIALTKKGDLYVLFNVVGNQQAVGRLDRNGYYTHMAGSPVLDKGTIDTGVDARIHKLIGATSIDVDKRGNVFICQGDMNRVLIVTPECYIDVAAGTGTASAMTGDGGPALQASLSSPKGILFCKGGNLLISDFGHRSLRIVNLGINKLSNTKFLPPRGYYRSDLVHREDGTWVRKYKDGTRVVFDKRGLHQSTTDRNGNRVEYHYTDDLLTSATYPGGAQLDFEYNDGVLKSITDHTGRKTSFDMTDNMLTSVNRADGTQRALEYDSEGRLLKKVLEDGTEISYQYDQHGKLLSQSMDGADTSLEYPADGSELSNEGEEPSGEEQDRISPYVQKRGPEGDTSSFRIEHGRLMEYIAGGVDIRIEYNVGLLPMLIERATGSRLSISYNDRGDRTGMEDSFLEASSLVEYNDEGLKVLSHDYEGRKTSFTYDERGNMTGISREGLTIVERTRDGQGLLSSVRDKGFTVSYGYDGMGNLVREERGDRLIEFVRNNAGAVTVEKSGDRRETGYGYDLFNRLVKVVEHRGETSYEYDIRGNMVKVTDAAGRIHEFIYDIRRNLVELRDPAGRAWKFAYNDEGRMLSRQYPDGSVTAFEYSMDGLFMTEVSGDKVARRRFNSDGSLLAAYNGHSTITKIYDEAGRLTGEHHWITEHFPIAVEYELDRTGRILQVNSPGEPIVYRYDVAGRLEGISCGGFETVLERNPEGRVVGLTRPDVFQTELQYYDSGALRSLNDTRQQGVIGTREFQYDSGGDIIKTVLDEDESDFSFDPDAQLVSVRSGALELLYEYDNTGNRTSGPDGIYQYDAEQIRLLECPRFQYEYDERGNLVRKTSKADPAEVHLYTYGPKGQLTQYTRMDGGSESSVQAVYRYDPADRRIYKKVAYRDEPLKEVETWYIYDRENVLLELDADLSIKRQYIHNTNLDGIMGFIEDGQVYYFARGHLGSVEKVLDSTGEIVCEYRYDPFGNLLVEKEQISNPYRFAGREWDPESGTYFFRKRTYDPGVGRFLQPDLAIGNQKRPLSMINRYVYAWNNPLRYIDPYGLEAVTAAMLGIWGLFTLGGILFGDSGGSGGSNWDSGSEGGTSNNYSNNTYHEPLYVPADTERLVGENTVEAWEEVCSLDREDDSIVAGVTEGIVRDMDLGNLSTGVFDSSDIHGQSTPPSAWETERLANVFLDGAGTPASGGLGDLVAQARGFSAREILTRSSELTYMEMFCRVVEFVKRYPRLGILNYELEFAFEPHKRLDITTAYNIYTDSSNKEESFFVNVKVGDFSIVFTSYLVTYRNVPESYSTGYLRIGIVTYRKFANQRILEKKYRDRLEKIYKMMNKMILNENKDMSELRRYIRYLTYYKKGVHLLDFCKNNPVYAPKEIELPSIPEVPSIPEGPTI